MTGTQKIVRECGFSERLLSHPVTKYRLHIVRKCFKDSLWDGGDVRLIQSRFVYNLDEIHGAKHKCVKVKPPGCV